MKSIGYRLAAMLITVLAECPNAVGIYRANSPLYIGPVWMIILVIAGSLLWITATSQQQESRTA